MKKTHILKTLWLLFVVLVLFVSCRGDDQPVGAGDTSAPGINADYLNAELSADERAVILLEQMELRDKVGQMTQVARDYLKSTDDIRTYRLGSILSGGGSAPEPNTVAVWRDMTNEMQDQALATLLAIPLIYGSDSVHGHGNLKDAVIFPHHIGLGAGNNPALVFELAVLNAKETAATGVKWNFSPCLTVPQDIRWGRTYEGFSSDPDIVSTLGKAETLGLQSGWNSSSTMLATLKHFVADGGTEGGVDRGDAKLSDQELADIHLYPYLASLEAGAGSVMVSYSSINGLAMHANGELINDCLKTTLEFDGFVVSDWAALKELPGDAKQQIATAINAGIDMVMVPDNYVSFIQDLTQLIEAGTIPMERIDDAVTRILRTKFAMGLFEYPYADPELENAVGSDEHRALARQAVAESLVLLKNDGILPLKAGQRVLVYGSYADDIGIQSGGWTLRWQGKPGNDNEGISVVEAFVGELGAENVRHVTTLDVLQQQDLDAFDLIVFVTGERPYAEMQGDKPRPGLPQAHLTTFEEIRATGLPVLSIILSGRPVLLGEVATSDALVAAWLPGTEGNGITDVLFGYVQFRGRLPFAWPKDEAGFIQGQEDAGYLYPLGYGLEL